MSGFQPGLVSVVIPCYNSAAFVADAVQSVLDQTYPDIEVVAVDDGSPDDSAAVLARYPAVRLVRQENRGQAGARNSGLAVATGELVVFLDADDRLHPDAVAAGVEAFRRHPDAGMVYGFASLIDQDGLPLPSTAPDSPPAGDFYALLLAGEVIIAPPACLMFRRAVVDAVGGFDPELLGTDDLDLFLKIARTHPVHCHGAVVCDYRIHGGNMSSDHVRMRSMTLAALDRQRDHALLDPAHARAYRAGRRHWRDYWGAAIGKDALVALSRRDAASARQSLAAVLRSPPGPKAFIRYAPRLRMLRSER